MRLGRAATVMLTGLALILIGWMFDATPLFVPGVAFSLLGILAPAWVAIRARGGQVESELEADRVGEDEPLQMTIHARGGRINLAGAVIEDPLSGRLIPLGTANRESGVNTVQVLTSFPRRGRVRVDPPSLRVRDPLDLAAVRITAGHPPREVLVLPRTEPVTWSGGGLGGSERMLEGWLRDAFAAADVDGLQPYRPGAPASRIHWPALARGAGLLERRLRADEDILPLVVLDARSADPTEQLDDAVRASASLALDLARRGGCRLLLPGERRPIVIDSTLRGWPAAHARLALVEGGARAKPPMLGAELLLGPVVYVAVGMPERIPTLPGSHLGLVLVLPRGVWTGAARTELFEVSGCRGLLVDESHRTRARRAA